MWPPCADIYLLRVRQDQAHIGAIHPTWHMMQMKWACMDGALGHIRNPCAATAAIMWVVAGSVTEMNRPVQLTYLLVSSFPMTSSRQRTISISQIYKMTRAPAVRLVWSSYSTKQSSLTSISEATFLRHQTQRRNYPSLGEEYLKLLSKHKMRRDLRSGLRKRWNSWAKRLVNSK